MFIYRFLVIAFILLLFIQVDVNFAQGNSEIPATKIDEPVSINGMLDEAIWKEAQPVTGFQQFEPNEGSPASQRTEVRVLYGEGNVYIGAILHDQRPSEIQQTLGRRDEYNQADWFLVSIDSYFNKRTAYTFGLNAAGVQFDALRSGGGGGGGDAPPGMDPSWDAVWESAVSVNDEGWVVEMRIPNSMLRFPDTDLQTWGIHFTRRIPRLGEVVEWPLVSRADRSNLVARFGRLTQIENIEPKPNIQVRPYTVAGLTSQESLQDPGRADVSTNMDLGGDLKIGLGPNITLDATINPDFGQVESDPAVLNLTAFETFFDEKRPFFIEGIQIYEFSVGPGELLYTRRIGAEAPIIGATKLSGRTESGTSFGILGATSGSDFDPSRNYGAARVRQQIGSVSEAGAIVTGYDAPSPDGTGRIQTASGGVDWDIRFLDNRYGVEGFSAFTHRNWTAPGRSSSTGMAGKVWLRKRQGILNGFVGLDLFGDEFDPNDIGQLRENNFIANLYRLEYQINRGEPFGPLRRADVEAFGIQQFSYDERLNLGFSLELTSSWMTMEFQEIEFGMNIERPFGGYDLFETRGLGPWARPASYQLVGEFNTDERRQWQVQPEASYTWHEDGGQGYAFGFWGDWNIGTRLNLYANLEGEWEEDVTAWASNESFRYTGSEWEIGERSASPDQLADGEYRTLENQGRLNTIFANISPYNGNTWYTPVFGRRDTRSLDLTLRSDVTFTPKLSLQLYSQLFLARGRYQDFKIMQDWDQLAGYSSYPKRSEFSLSSLQSNVVLRWEYQPGSNIYLVWTHGRQLRESLNPLAPYGRSPYGRSINQRINDTFEIFPENALLLKIEYTFLY
ncbi:DUF5916 domain-containing protein [Halalkalibaculum sp. DA3122]|uniref:DUF5916 domain-containing protein n=1 Tax=Halalkalibaculum sp. DA3122 TaxID=3373607 RepID=UPI003754C797